MNLSLGFTRRLLTIPTSVAVASLLSFACAKKTPVEATQAAAKENVNTPAAKDAAIPARVESMLANFRRVQFEFDSFKLSEETQSALTANAELMVANPDVRVEVQGHADEQGTSEYNLALGENRAKAIRDFMSRSGVDPARIQVISYGEEKPLEAGSSEQAWSMNRRGEFKVLWGQPGVVGTTE
ncbi:MAG: peptidoglycan-associated lipoprotein Pal [Deltaproteobacteria bacterium]|nr:peptidoglycan-associated lipoprotein Pal [Deltaproteobacteria bacterium]